MYNFFKRNLNSKEKNLSVMSIACLLIHAARIDESYTEKEKIIIKETLIKLGYNQNNIENIIKEAEEKEKDSNQILEFTKDVKNLNDEKKKVLLEALWSIIYSDTNADAYETNLMRRLTGLLYLDKRVVGDIKENIKNKK